MSCNLPDKIGAGLTFDRLLTLTAYPAPEWSVSILLRGASSIDLTAAAEGTQHRFNASAAVTGAWTPGDYWYSLRATKGADVVEVEQGSLTIAPDIANAGAGYNGRSDAETALAAINAVLSNRATLDQERYRINNRELYRTPIVDLIRLRDFYLNQVRQEKAAACGKSLFGATVRVRLK